MRKNWLVPVVKPDINGKLVTRHVLADKGTGDRAHIPAPAGTPQVLGVKECARRIADNMMSEAQDPPGQHRAAIARIYEDSLDLHSLIGLIERQKTLTTLEKSVLQLQSYTLFRELASALVDGTTKEKVFAGVLDSLDTIGNLLIDHGSTLVAQSSLITINDAEAMGGIDPRSSSDYERDVYRFLFFRRLIGDSSFMDQMEVYEKSVWFAESKERLLIHSNQIMSRGGDWEWMKEVTDPETAPSLSEGTL